MMNESKINLLGMRLNRLVSRSISKENSGVRRKIQRQIKNLKKATETEQRQR